VVFEISVFKIIKEKIKIKENKRIFKKIEKLIGIYVKEINVIEKRAIKLFKIVSIFLFL
jgi:hypothetical protein